MLVGVFLHIRRKKLRRIQVLTLFKIAILLFIVVTGTMIKFLGDICARKYQTDAQVGSSFLVKRVFKIHTQTSAMHSREALQVVMMFVSASFRYLPLIRYAIHQYATAMFKILFSYSGWQNANYVLNEVKNPIRTIKIAGPLGLGITSALYIFANIAYFAYVRSSFRFYST